MYKPSTYLEITYFLIIYLYMRTISYKIGYQGQHANAISQKQNVINPPTWGLKGRWRKTMGLFNYIFHDGCKGISHGIMGHHPFPTMSTMKEVNPHGSKGWPQMQCDKPRPMDGGGPTWCTSRRKKCLKPNKKKGWLGGQTTRHPLSTLYKTSNVHDVNP
jgi:hypothetical protein